MGMIIVFYLTGVVLGLGYGGFNLINVVSLALGKYVPTKLTIIEHTTRKSVQGKARAVVIHFEFREREHFVRGTLKKNLSPFAIFNVDDAIESIKERYPVGSKLPLWYNTLYPHYFAEKLPSIFWRGAHSVFAVIFGGLCLQPLITIFF